MIPQVKNLPVTKKIALIIALSVTGMVLLQIFLFIQLNNDLMDARQDKIRGMVESTTSTINYYHSLETNGTLSRDEAQKQAIAQLQVLRYDQEDYYWVSDLSENVIMHGAKPELTGKNMSSLKDPEGVPIFVEFSRIGRESGSGFVGYMWPKPGLENPVAKISYVELFEPWGWVLGTGVYIDDINNLFWSEVRYALLIFSVLIVLMVLLSLGLAKTITTPLLHFSSIIKRVDASGNLSDCATVYGQDEVGEATSAFNHLMQKIHHIINEANEVSSNLAAGNFDKRITLECAGHLNTLKTGINGSADNIEHTMEAFNRLMDALAEGNFRQNAEINVTGEYRKAVDNAVGAMHDIDAAIQEIIVVMNALKKGDFSHRVDAELKGDLNLLKQQANEGLDGIQQAMSIQYDVMTAMAEGDFSRHFSIQTSGEFKKNIDKATNSMQSMGEAVTTLNTVMASLAQGDCSQRVTVDLPGDLGKLKDNVNQSMDIIERIIGDVAKVLTSLAGGDLTQSISHNYSGIFNKLKQDANTTNHQLANSINQIQDAFVQVSIGAREIAEGSSDLSHRTESQASTLQQTSALMEQVTKSAFSSAQSADNAKALAAIAQEKAIRGKDIVGEAVSAMEAIGQSSERIGSIIGVINEIAFQTNLLALNAAVEAARAGEQGRGFAVVAAEVRNLAQRSANSAKEIKELISSSVIAIQSGTERVFESGRVLEDMLHSVDQVNDRISDISQSTQQQNGNIRQINQAISLIDENTQQNAAMVEEFSASTETMAEQANNVQKQIGFFKVTPS